MTVEEGMSIIATAVPHDWKAGNKIKFNVNGTIYEVSPPVSVGVGGKFRVGLPMEARVPQDWKAGNKIKFNVNGTIYGVSPPVGVGVGGKFHVRLPIEARVQQDWKAGNKTECNVDRMIYEAPPPAGVGAGEAVRIPPRSTPVNKPVGEDVRKTVVSKLVKSAIDNVLAWVKVRGHVQQDGTITECLCGTPSIDWILDASGVSDAIKKRAAILTTKRQHTFPMGQCPECNRDMLDNHVQRALNRTPIQELDRNLIYEQGRCLNSFAFYCYSDLGRKAVMSTVELFRKIVCIKSSPDGYKKYVHNCSQCEDHFYGEGVEIDHTGRVEFSKILLAFLDAHVPDWFIPPDKDTVKDRQNYGWRATVKASHKLDLVETETAYWQRVKNVAKTRWVCEDLGEKFVTFHNSVACLRDVCHSCHDDKSMSRCASFASKKRKRSASFARAFDPELGASKKRSRDLQELEERKIREKPPATHATPPASCPR